MLESLDARGAQGGGNLGTAERAHAVGGERDGTGSGRGLRQQRLSGGCPGAAGACEQQLGEALRAAEGVRALEQLEQRRRDEPGKRATRKRPG